MSDVLEDDTEPKIALTLEQVAELLSFMESDKVYKQYRDEIIILLETGLRVSELSAKHSIYQHFKGLIN